MVPPLLKVEGAVNIASVLDPVVAAEPSRVALVIGDDVVTYEELDRAVARCAAALVAHGVQRGDRIAVVEVGGLLSTAVILGAAHIGAAAALMNVQLKTAELQELVRTSDCAAIGVAGEPFRDALGTAVKTVLGAAELLGGDSVEAPARVEPDDDLDALVRFTSGTTGLPKAIPITAGPLARRLQSMGLPFDPSVPPVVGFMCVPVFHVGGSLGLVSALRGGRTTVVQARFDAGEWLRLVEQHRVTSVGRRPKPIEPRTWPSAYSRRWRMSAAFGSPVVPLV